MGKIKEMGVWLRGNMKGWLNFHRPGKKKNLFVFTMPRSGSTWLMEILCTQPETKYCNEPLYLENSLVKKYSGLTQWTDLHDPSKKELLKVYFQNLNNGRFGFLNPNPFGDYYRMFTNRIVYKVIHGGEENINWFSEQFNGKIIFLIRHPIAVSISRKKLFRLEAMIESDYGNHFTHEQREFSRKLIKEGTHREKAVLSWCLQNYVPLKSRSKDWVFITYEQLVSEPEKVLNVLQKELDLVNLDVIRENISKPSLVKNLSDRDTKEMLANADLDRELLVKKWRDKVTPEEEMGYFEIIDQFGIDVYSPLDFYPNPKYLV